MSRITFVRHLECSRCGDEFIAPDSSEFISEQEVRNHWRCVRCGCEVETSFQLTSRDTLSPEIIEQFFPSLLVA